MPFQRRYLMAQRKKHTAQLKAKVALEALKEKKTVNQICSEHEVHAAQVSQWKKAAVEFLQEGFKSGSPLKKKDDAGFTKEEYCCQIGKLQMELDWLKKKYGMDS